MQREPDHQCRPVSEQTAVVDGDDDVDNNIINYTDDDSDDAECNVNPIINAGQLVNKLSAVVDGGDDVDNNIINNNDDDSDDAECSVNLIINVGQIKEHVCCC